MLWRTELEDVTQLLGVAGDCLIAGGRRLYWIGLDATRSAAGSGTSGPTARKSRATAGASSPPAMSSGPRGKRYTSSTSRPPHLGKVIDLAPLGTTGGNLLLADGRLLMANGSELVALGRPAKTANNKGRRVDRRDFPFRPFFSLYPSIL